MIDLDDLEDYFDDLSIDGPTKEQLFKLYNVFLNDFQKSPIAINGVLLKYNNQLSRHPVCSGKAQSFEHIITRESKYSNKRQFDPERANKLHWIKPIIQNAENPRIKYFEEINHNGQRQLFYWFEEKTFVVIVRELKPDYLLITAYNVDTTEKLNLKKKYARFKA